MDGPVPKRDLEMARKAHSMQDAEMSRTAHQQLGAAKESHNHEAGPYVKSIVFGGLDGVITCFAIVAGVAGAGLDTEVVLMLGLANLFADALSMGVGDYLSEKAEIDYTVNERKREEWEVENYIEGERQEMVELYVNRGMTQEDATLIINTMSKYKDIFVDTMMVEELGLMAPDPDDNPAKKGLVTFLSFIVFGVVPLLAYIFGFTDTGKNTLFFISIAMTACTLVALGLVKATFTSQPRVKTALWMLVNGGCAALASYLIGWGVESAL